MIATAVGDDATRLAAAHNAFTKLDMISSHLALFSMPNVPDVRAHLMAQDIIWVGGGSTANLLALWRLHGLDVILRECWEAGVVLKGVSAGSLCWHVGGTTDSFGPVLQPVTDGLGFLPYSNSPHHDAEPLRRPTIHRLIAEGTLPDGYATENGTGLVFYGTELHEAITEEAGKTTYSLTRQGDAVVETALPTRVL
jgi:peptidase E